MKRTGSIYIIECICSEKVYIGQTLRSNVADRWKEHLKTASQKENQLPLYRALRKFGVENFIFRVLETGIPQEFLDKKEQEYITEYNSFKEGYNCTEGGDVRCKGVHLNEKGARKVIKLIRENPDHSFVEISNILNIPYGCVSDINCGETWYFSDESYPIRIGKRRPNKIGERITEVYEMLRNREKISEIARKFNVSTTCISNINKGKIYKQEDIEYPIYQPINSNIRLNKEQIQIIVDLLLSKDCSYAYLSKITQFRSGRKTIAGINNGTLYRESLEEMGYTEFPLRK